MLVNLILATPLEMIANDHPSQGRIRSLRNTDFLGIRTCCHHKSLHVVIVGVAEVGAVVVEAEGLVEVEAGVVAVPVEVGDLREQEITRRGNVLGKTSTSQAALTTIESEGTTRRWRRLALVPPADTTSSFFDNT